MDLVWKGFVGFHYLFSVFKVCYLLLLYFWLENLPSCMMIPKMFKFWNQCFAPLRFGKSVSRKTAVAPSSRFCESKTLFQNRSRSKHWFKNIIILEQTGKCGSNLHLSALMIKLTIQVTHFFNSSMTSVMVFWGWGWLLTNLFILIYLKKQLNIDIHNLT